MSEIFERVLCGVDNSEAGELAARLAARVTLPEGSLAIVSVEDTAVGVYAGSRTAVVRSEISGAAHEALERGSAVAGAQRAVASRLVRGATVETLLAEIEREQATLVVVGTHDLGRLAAIALGSVATALLHKAPCSVLLARAPRDLERWPRSVVVGIDGSPESAAAVEAARGLAARFGAALRVVVATGDHVDLEAARVSAPELEELPGKVVDELAVLSEFNDLVVVGSRGLKGIRALGSVSERVAHRASSPVLVVRYPQAGSR